jgi:hypothetical protein
MLQARLKNIWENLADAQQQLDPTRARPPVAPRSQPVTRISFAPMINATTITMPTSLLEQANIKLSVAGVEVSGAVAWLRNLLVRQRTLAFTVNTAPIAKDGRGGRCTGAEPGGRRYLHAQLNIP